MAIRAVHATGNAFVITATFTYAAVEFENSVGTIFSLTRFAMNFAQLLGPSIGGAIYEAGGFYLPFVAMGSVQMLMGILSIFCLPRSRRWIHIVWNCPKSLIFPNLICYTTKFFVIVNGDREYRLIWIIKKKLKNSIYFQLINILCYKDYNNNYLDIFWESKWMSKIWLIRYVIFKTFWSFFLLFIGVIFHMIHISCEDIYAYVLNMYINITPLCNNNNNNSQQKQIPCRSCNTII